MNDTFAVSWRWEKCLLIPNVNVYCILMFFVLLYAANAVLHHVHAHAHIPP
uniref:Uncharacterized protein n=1 Tax=Anguilla anguilla TaxID=7936 RepID=A0A0E9XD02_ANGAN